MLLFSRCGAAGGVEPFWKRQICWVLNACWWYPCAPRPREKGRKERETLQQMAEVAREGFRLKKILIEDWKKAREEKQVSSPVGLTQDILDPVVRRCGRARPGGAGISLQGVS